MINENYNEDLDENIQAKGIANHVVPKWESNKNNLNEITKGIVLFIKSGSMLSILETV